MRQRPSFHFAHHVHLQHAQPIHWTQIREWKAEFPRSNSCGMHQVIDGTEDFGCLLRYCEHDRFVGHVNGNSDRADRKRLLDFLGDLHGAVTQIPDGDVRTFRRERHCGCTADPAAATCNYNDMIFQI
jgi:hypothetical protein